MKKGYKRGNKGEMIVLGIPDYAVVVSFDGVCRCDTAMVLGITDTEIGNEKETARSIHNPEFEYRKGQMVKSDNFCKNTHKQYVSGIHYFENRERAEAYFENRKDMCGNTEKILQSEDRP